MTNASDSSDIDTSNNSSEEEDDDPRITAMFQITAGSNDENKTTTMTTTRKRELHISEHSILDCFQRALDSHDCKNPRVNGIWKAPSLFQIDDNGKKEEQEEQVGVSIADWKPASLPLPAWVVQPPVEITSPPPN